MGLIKHHSAQDVLTLGLLSTTLWPFAYSVDQDQTEPYMRLIFFIQEDIFFSPPKKPCEVDLLWNENLISFI